MQEAERCIATDPQWARFMASAVYTSLGAKQDFVHDEEATRFHQHLATRAVAAFKAHHS